MRTDAMKLIIAFRNFANAPKKRIKLVQETVQTRSLVNTAFHQRIQQASGDFLNSLRPSAFPEALFSVYNDSMYRKRRKRILCLSHTYYTLEAGQTLPWSSTSERYVCGTEAKVHQV